VRGVTNGYRIRRGGNRGKRVANSGIGGFLSEGKGIFQVLSYPEGTTLQRAIKDAKKVFKRERKMDGRQMDQGISGKKNSEKGQ